MTVPVSRPSEGLVRAEVVTKEEPEPVGRASTRTVTVPRIAGRGPFTVRTWIPVTTLLGILALVLYLAVWIIGWAWPLILHDQLIQLDQSSQDPNFYTWSLRWWPYAVSHGLNPLFSRQIGAPS